MMIRSPGATDCHVHVFSPATSPYQPARSYTPGPATTTELREHLQRVGTERVVLVQPSVYGSDNRAMLAAMAELGPAICRGVAVVDSATTPGELDEMVATGVRGLRLNVSSDPRGTTTNFTNELAALIQRAATHNLFVEIFAAHSMLEQARTLIEDSPVPILLDHFGGVHATTAGTLDGAATVLHLYSHPHVWIKLSAPYRLGDPADIAHGLPPFVSDLASISPKRLLWASDWPHTGGGRDRATRSLDAIEPFRNYNATTSVEDISDWLPTPQAVADVFTHNPASLYDFPTTDPSPTAEAHHTPESQLE
ncbi:amidohydrolase family protein [Corynebacterium sp. CNJ-954]|uniref:amidohydrolase family protein n=1 Tax=Corynebacterium sp. CNJ-954 TaxID=1904962 RepID=UPI00096A3B98